MSAAITTLLRLLHRWLVAAASAELAGNSYSTARARADAYTTAVAVVAGVGDDDVDQAIEAVRTGGELAGLEAAAFAAAVAERLPTAPDAVPLVVDVEGATAVTGSGPGPWRPVDPDRPGTDAALVVDVGWEPTGPTVLDLTDQPGRQLGIEGPAGAVRAMLAAALRQLDELELAAAGRCFRVVHEDDGPWPWTVQETQHHLPASAELVPPRRFATEAEAAAWVASRRPTHDALYHQDGDQ